MGEALISLTVVSVVPKKDFLSPDGSEFCFILRAKYGKRWEGPGGSTHCSSIVLCAVKGALPACSYCTSTNRKIGSLCWRKRFTTLTVPFLMNLCLGSKYACTCTSQLRLKIHHGIGIK